jgi:enolase
MTSNISALIKIVKKWAKNGNLESRDVARVVILAADEFDKASKYNYKGKLKRKDFSKTTQKKILVKQKYKCNMCKKKLDEINWDHIDGNRSNNSITNCQALCPNCHAKKTRKRLQGF